MWCCRISYFKLLYIIASLTNDSNAPICINNEAFVSVNMEERYNDTSTEAVVQAVVTNGTHTLSLGGKDTTSNDSKNNQCILLNTVYAYKYIPM